MRRLAIVLAVAAATLLGVLATPAPRASASPPAAVNGGSVTLTVGADDFGLPGWTIAFAGNFTVGGQTYAGSATGTGRGGHNFVDITSLAGSSSTGTLNGSCSGEFVETLPSTIVGGPPPAVLPDHDFTGVISLSCDVSINGRPSSAIGLTVGLLPTTNARVFKGLYAETPSTTAAPTLPLISGGLAGAITDSGDGVPEPSISFQYVGQITLGGQTFHGDAGGEAFVEPTTSAAIPPFLLANAVSSSDTLSATCSGQWRSTGMVLGLGVGAALSVLTCSGTVNGGPPGTVTLVSVYAQTTGSVHPGEVMAGYTGVFAGL